MADDKDLSNTIPRAQQELEKLKAALEDQDKKVKALTDSLKNASDESIKALTTQKDIAEQSISFYTQAIVKQQEQIRQLGEIAKHRKENIDDLKKELEARKSNIKNDEEKAKYEKDHLDFLKKELDYVKLTGEGSKEELARRKKEIELLEEKDTLLKKQKEKLEKSLSIMGDFANSITAGNAGLIRQIGSLDSLKTITREILDSNIALTKLTGDYSGLSREAFGGMAQYGVGYKEAAEAHSSLYANMSMYSVLSKETQNDLGKQEAAYGNLGISIDSVSKNLNVLTKGVRFGATEAAEVNNKIIRTSYAAGISPAKAMSDLSAMMPALAANGKKAVDVFINLEKQSKALGIEANTLLGTMSQFDTFESAADKAGMLNSILGGDYLNSVEMLNATEDERIEILKNSFEQSGKNFEQLNRFEKKNIAQALGLRDVAEAQSLLGELSREEIANNEARAIEQKELNKIMEKSADSMRQIQAILAELAIVIKPVLAGIRSFIAFLAEWPRATAAAAGALMLFRGFFSPLTVAFKSISFASSIATKGIESTGKALSNVPEKASASVGPLLALGAAFLMVGFGIKLASEGLAELAKALSLLNGEQLTVFGGVMLGFVAIVALLAFTAIYASGPLYVLGGALLMIGGSFALLGAGIALAGYGMKMLSDAIVNIAKNAGEGLEKVAKGIVSIGIALTEVASIKVAAGLAVLLKGLSEIADTISEFPDEVSFSAKVSNLKSIGDTIKVANEAGDSIQPAKNFIVAAKEYYIAQKDSKSADNDALVQALRSVVSNEKSAQVTNTSGKTPVILRIENGPDLRAWVLAGKTTF